jgi:hypothetical protein
MAVDRQDEGLQSGERSGAEERGARGCGGAPAKAEEARGGGAGGNRVPLVVGPAARAGHGGLDGAEHAGVGGVEGGEAGNVGPDGEDALGGRRPLTK